MSASEFCKNAFPWRLTIDWIGRVGTLDLGRHRFARIILSTRCCTGYPTADHYNGFAVQIIDTNAGKIDSAKFRFDDLLHNGGNPKCHYSVISYADWGWYTTASQPAPQNTVPVADAIENYAMRFIEGI